MAALRSEGHLQVDEGLKYIRLHSKDPTLPKRVWGEEENEVSAH